MKRDTDESGAVRASSIKSLKALGFTYTAAARIYDVYDDESVDIVTSDPYRVAIDIPGIGFKTADAAAAAIASASSIASAAGPLAAAAHPLAEAQSDPSLPHYEHRVTAGIIYILSRYVSEGHACVPRSKLIDRAVELMDVTSDDVMDGLLSLALDGRAMEAPVDGAPCVFLSMYFTAERGICSHLMRLMSSDPKHLYADPDDLILKSESSLGIALSGEQRSAVKDSIQSSVFVLTGGPGTGKTTIIRAVIDIFEHAGLKTAVAAPTGRAAKRVTEATGYKACTIHRLLEYYYDEYAREMYFGRNAENQLGYNAIIIDEASMVDDILMNALLSAIPSGARLIIVGDADQLPPVGAGDVLRSILESERVPNTMLTEIYRQAAESMIVVNAHRINRGEYPDTAGADGGEEGFNVNFIMEEKYTGIAALKSILRMYSERLPAAIPGIVPIRDIQTLTPMKKGMLGCVNLNTELQAVLNPPDPSKAEKKYGERVFREGDRVMQIRNNYSIEWFDTSDGSTGHGVFNGDMGIITDINPSTDVVTVTYDDLKCVSYGADSLPELDHSFAITVHKSQGSEFPVVIIPVYAAAPMLMTRNLIYTAVTRGKRLVILIGSPEKLHRMVDNDTGRVRYSGLKSFLMEYLNMG
jgi:exodeoxyribonuclease V alpha subunit